MKKIVLILLLIYLPALFAQETSQIDAAKQQQDTQGEADSLSRNIKSINFDHGEKDSAGFDFKKWIPWILSVILSFLLIVQYFRMKPDAFRKKTGELEAEAESEKKKDETQKTGVEQILKKALTEELGSIRLLGSPEIQNIPVKLLDSFVNLRISETFRSEEQFENKRKQHIKEFVDRDFNPDEILKRAFSRYRMLLIIGDPGFGKTTLLKYYAITCLDGGYQKLGFDKPILPLYLPLRELVLTKSLCENLVDWAKRHEHKITDDVFYDWLHNKTSLVLLDGLDEISEIEKRRQVCKWIDEKAAGLTKARFVVTSRWTGYKKLDGIEIGFDHLRADIKEFTPQQQEEFIRKWFAAVARVSMPPKGEEADWKERNLKRASKRAQELIDYLKKSENKALRELMVSPLLLQIIAILGKERAFHATNRTELYSAALNYLLDYRDRKRELYPKLPAKQARSVLAPTAFWMQEKVRRDDVSRDDMHDTLLPFLKPIDDKLSPGEFCKNLCERAGILAELGTDEYIFRHKSFREYLCSLHIFEKAHDSKFLEKLVAYFGDDWWEEPFRFFMGESNAEKFDNFMRALFNSSVTDELDQKAQNLLQTMVKDASARKIDGLVDIILLPN